MTDRLLALLQTKANDRGRVLVRESVLLEELWTSPAALAGALHKLASSRKIEILSPAPFLTILLLEWPGSIRKSPETGQSDASFHSFQELSQSRRIDESFKGEGEQLLQEILVTLGESDPTTFRQALAHFTPESIRLVLDRVREAKRLRTNRTALFRFLLPRLGTKLRPSANT